MGQCLVKVSPMGDDVRLPGTAIKELAVTPGKTADLNGRRTDRIKADWPSGSARTRRLPADRAADRAAEAQELLSPTTPGAAA